MVSAVLESESPVNITRAMMLVTILASMHSFLDLGHRSFRIPACLGFLVSFRPFTVVSVANLIDRPRRPSLTSCRASMHAATYLKLSANPPAFLCV